MATYLKHNIEVISGNLYYHGRNRQLSHEIKRGDMGAITLAAWEMAEWIEDWSNVALVPIPSHRGKATYTLHLAKAIGKGEVFDILRCRERETLYSRKHAGKRTTAFDLGFYAIGKIPADKRIVFVDNVVATGTTAKAAVYAVGPGTVLSFSYAKIG